MPESFSPEQKPRFLLEDIDNEAALLELSAFQDAVYADPDSVQNWLDIADPETIENPYQSGIALAISKEFAPEFDESTQKQIRMSALIRELQEMRKNNAGNEDVVQRLAARLRLERLKVFIGQVSAYNTANQTEVVQLPESSATTIRRRVRRVDGQAS